MGVLLGANGSLESTLKAIKSAHRAVSLSLVTGKDYTGIIVGPPGDTYVVLRPGIDPTASDESFDVMVMYSAVATVQVVKV
jgi:hypothetical protein